MFKGIYDTVYYSISAPVREYNDSHVYEETRVDIDDRWDFIASYLDGADTAIDIGCAEGYYVRRLAQNDIFTIGIELEAERVRTAREEAGDLERCGFVNMAVNPGSVGVLPSMDVTLLLTVHHHWDRMFGLEQASRMFEIIMDKSKLVIYEPPGDRPLLYSKAGYLDPSKSVSFYSAKLNALYGDRITIIDSMLTNYRSTTDDDRLDPVFVIDTSEFDLKNDAEPSLSDGALSSEAASAGE